MSVIKLSIYGIFFSIIALLVYTIPLTAAANDDIRYHADDVKYRYLATHKDGVEFIRCIPTSKGPEYTPSAAQKMMEARGAYCTRSYHGNGRMLMIDCSNGISPVFLDTLASCELHKKLLRKQ